MLLKESKMPYNWMLKFTWENYNFKIQIREEVWHVDYMYERDIMKSWSQSLSWACVCISPLSHSTTGASLSSWLCFFWSWQFYILFPDHKLLNTDFNNNPLKNVFFEFHWQVLKLFQWSVTETFVCICNNCSLCLFSSTSQTTRI